MDLKYLKLEGEAAAMDKKETEKNELLSEQETNNGEARVESRDGELTVPRLDLARLGYTTAQDCAYCLARIIAYTTYVSRQQRQ